MRKATSIVHSGFEPDPTFGALSVPIYQASTFDQTTVGHPVGQWFYGRGGNPTRHALEVSLAELECGQYAYAFASGMAAVDATCAVLSNGDRLICANAVYGGAYEYFTTILPSRGVSVDFVDCTDYDQLEASLKKGARLLWIETPSNPALTIIDIDAVCKLAHKYGVLVAADNTFASPYLQNPLNLGVDIVMHSCTKYLGGHSDVIAGAVVLNDKELAHRIYHHQVVTGNVLGPFDSWLVFRGIRTLKVRMQAHCENALRIAQALVGHPKLERVLYPGLSDHPGHDIAVRQMKDGFGGMISVVVKGGSAEAKKFAESTKLFSLAVSLGGVESLIGYPPSSSHRPMDQAARQAAGALPNLVRLSVGIEDHEDLLEDILAALDAT
ncbi:MAG: trans-sulfuration enzyme family protein [Armatimonadota bacterium]